MKVNLRRAAALQHTIQEALRGIELQALVNLDEFQDAEAVIREQHARLEANLERRHELNLVLYSIRQAVSQANHTAGVDMRLADIACQEQHLKDLATLSAVAERVNPVVIQGRLEKIRRDTSDRPRVYDNTVETSVLSAEDLHAYRRGMQILRKQRQDAQDEILNLNVRTEIELSDHAVHVLRREGLI
jgi:hypothetical protein